MKNGSKFVFSAALFLGLALGSIPVCSAQSSKVPTAEAKRKWPDDEAYDLAHRLHDAPGHDYCAKPLTVADAQFLLQHYAAHQGSKLSENSYSLNDGELTAVKSMANGHCQQSSTAPAKAELPAH